MGGSIRGENNSIKSVLLAGSIKCVVLGNCFLSSLKCYLCYRTSRTVKNGGKNYENKYYKISNLEWILWSKVLVYFAKTWFSDFQRL